MAFYTPESAINLVSAFSQMLTPQQGRTIERTGRFICTLIEERIKSSQQASERYTKDLLGLFTNEPLPPTPGDRLAVEYFYGNSLRSMTEADEVLRENYSSHAKDMLQQGLKQLQKRTELLQEHLQRKIPESLGEVSLLQNTAFLFFLRHATIRYFVAATHFLYPQKPEEVRRAQIRSNLDQALATYEELNQYFDRFNETFLGQAEGIFHQDVLLGLMRGYALQGNYRKLMKAADQLETVLSKPENLPLDCIVAYAQRIEYSAREKRIWLGRCRPFVPECPERVVQELEQFITQYEQAPRKLIMRSPYFGQQEIGRNIPNAA